MSLRMNLKILAMIQAARNAAVVQDHHLDLWGVPAEKRTTVRAYMKSWIITLLEQVVRDITQPTKE